VERGDALAWLRRSRRTFDLVFCDPPYRLADRLAPELESLVQPRLRSGARVILESSSRSPVRLGLDAIVERRYGEAHVAVYAAPEG
jgi:16S rRNA G966 N2-methylase RsmD